MSSYKHIWNIINSTRLVSGDVFKGNVQYLSNKPISLSLSKWTKSRINKKAVRIIAGAKYRAPTDALFLDLGILKFVDVNIYLTMLFMFRVHNNMVPDQFQMMFNYNRDIHPYVTRQSNHLHIPMAKTNLGKKCIRYHGSVIWNKVIKLNIPTDTSEAVFKRSVKKEIIRGVWLFISE